MSNTDIYDEDLNPVLDHDATTNEDLAVLHDIVMSKLSETLSIEDAYKRHYPDHKAYADLIAKEIRDFGGNSLVNVFRRQGPPYIEVVCDVAKAVKAPFSRADTIDQIESSILATVLAKAFDRMSEDEKAELLGQIGRPNWSASAAVSAATFQAIFNAGGFASYRLMLVAVNALVRGAIGRGLPFAANAALMRVMGIAAGPVGWALTTLLAAFQFTSPSYKVTIPCVAYVAMLRKSHATLRCSQCDAVIDGGFRFCPECGAKIGEAL